MTTIYIRYIFLFFFQFNFRKIVLCRLMLKETNFSWFWIFWVSFATGVVVVVVVVSQCMRLPLLKRRLDEFLLLNCLLLHCLPLNQLPLLRNSSTSSSLSSQVEPSLSLVFCY
jgi:hypothetical protein